jgi:radical SAM protein with 4Fe4S-binding SPASM domain
VIYKLKELGLRPLAVHFDNGWNSELAVANIKNALDELKIDLNTYVVDWEEFKDLQMSFLKASVPNCEIPTDHAITATLVRNARAVGTPYANWLLEVFERWWAESAPFRVRIFEQIVGAALGVPFRSDALGGQENEVLVVETNGDIGPVDVLRAALPGSSRTGVNVLANSLDEGLQQETVALYHASHSAICAQCRRCPINQICGGGYLSHRYARANGFENPSVYCGDLTALIVTLRERALSILSLTVREQADLLPLTLAEAVALQRGA